MNISVLKGLPVRTLKVKDKDGKESEFNISTESVQSLVTPFVEEKFSLLGVSRPHYEEFDNQVKYYIPDSIFTLSNEKVLDYIHNYIDEEVGMSDNELISRFMGNPPDIKYDSSWDALMKVVQNINYMDDYEYSVYIMTMDCRIEDKKGKVVASCEGIHNPDELIKSVYAAVVDFINWYNKKIHILFGG